MLCLTVWSNKFSRFLNTQSTIALKLSLFQKLNQLTHCDASHHTWSCDTRVTRQRRSLRVDSEESRPPPAALAGMSQRAPLS